MDAIRLGLVRPVANTDPVRRRVLLPRWLVRVRVRQRGRRAGGLGRGRTGLLAEAGRERQVREGGVERDRFTIGLPGGGHIACVGRQAGLEREARRGPYAGQQVIHDHQSGTCPVACLEGTRQSEQGIHVFGPCPEDRSILLDGVGWCVGEQDPSQHRPQFQVIGRDG